MIEDHIRHYNLMQSFIKGNCLSLVQNEIEQTGLTIGLYRQLWKVTGTSIYIFACPCLSQTSIHTWVWNDLPLRNKGVYCSLYQCSEDNLIHSLWMHHGSKVHPLGFVFHTTQLTYYKNISIYNMDTIEPYLKIKEKQKNVLQNLLQMLSRATLTVGIQEQSKMIGRENRQLIPGQTQAASWVQLHNWGLRG